jgi:hypothetical protein
VIPVIIRLAGTIKIIQKIPEQDIEKSRNVGTTQNSRGRYRTHTLEMTRKSTKHSAWEIAFHVPCTVTKEQLQHYTP